MLDPTNRVIMVSGASRGIGRAVLERLLSSGFIVSAGVRNARGLQASDRLMLHPYDAESLDSAKGWVDATMARFGVLHGLVNSAGINTPYTLADEDETALDSLLTVNIKGPLRLIRLTLPHLKACGEGRLINLASLSGKRVANKNIGYAMTKFAVVALTHAVRQDAWDSGVRATAVCPGLVATDMTVKYASTFPIENMTDPKDLAVMIEAVMLLPNTATIAELLVNCRLESSL